ncbi:MAG: hypothetical protein H8D67_21430 [Deltaproteobacteria bacterium]|nr:hypothetical protein [Deltaproteobacteria bacterium]
MKCVIYGIIVDSIEEGIQQGWIPYFYEEETEHECACPGCAEVFLELGKDKEMEVKEEYRGKITYLDEKPKEHLVMGVMIR